MNKQLISLWFFSLLLLISFPIDSGAKEVTVEPKLTLLSVYDDNLDFDSSDELDSFGANAIPGLTLTYASELLQFSLIGEVDVIKYFTETDFDRTNHLYGFDGQYQMSPRWRFAGDFEYRRDETIDTLLEETGQAFDRRKVTTYDSGAGLFFDITELSDIGLEADYRKRSYSSNRNTDFDRYTFSIPFTKRFANQRDKLTLLPAYTIFDSDNAEDAKDYRFVVQWERQLNETLRSTVDAGGRYTDIEQEDGSSDTNWGYLGVLGLRNETETCVGQIRASRDIRANSNAEIVEVNRLRLDLDKQLSERYGFKFYGAGYYTDTESNEARNRKTTFFEFRPSLYYLLTENHLLEVKYEYQNKKEHSREGNPVTERNRVWLGLTLKFPKKW
jgi:hypothetical protein